MNRRGTASPSTLRAVALLTAAIGVGRVRADSENSSSTTTIYVVAGVVVLLFVGVGVFLWTRSRVKSTTDHAIIHKTIAVPQQPPPLASTASPTRAPREAEYSWVMSSPPPTRPRRPTLTALERQQRAREAAARARAEIQSDPATARLEIAYASLDFARRIFTNFVCDVWIAQFENRPVAVKRMLFEKINDDKEIGYFATEVKLMARFHHPTIVALVGVSWNPPHDPLCAVSEYVSEGDLYRFLKRTKRALNWPDHKIHMVQDVADALRYLHTLQPPVLHRDLKSSSILVDERLHAKLSNVGIDRQFFYDPPLAAGLGPFYWTAPEVLLGEKYTVKADIYAFGIVLSEIDTHQVPYADVRDETGRKLQGMRILMQIVKQRLRPTLGVACPTAVRGLAAQCLDAEPDARPDASELLGLIQRMTRSPLYLE